MHHIKIHKLGPIKDCELSCSKFMTLTGFQASGKSTIAKAIFYFRTIKDDIYSLVESRALSGLMYNSEYENISLKKLLIDTLREKFLRVFGSSWGMDNDMYLEYHYSDQCFVQISLTESKLYQTPNYIWITLSPALTGFLNKHENVLTADALGIPETQKQKLKTELNTFFEDEYSAVYIPAGRSMLTLLSQQLSYIYTTMKDSQKRTLDYCTQDYIERILRLRTEFSNGLEGIATYPTIRSKPPRKTVELALRLIGKVLRGSYSVSNGEERIVLEDGHYVKINFASSGQQEAVWMLNLLFYYLIQNEPTFFILEEPESNLFPESQKYVSEFISLVNNSQHSVLLTTHSPYVLGTLNNLLYANQTPAETRGVAHSIIPEQLWLDRDQFEAWFVRYGGIENSMDTEIGLIQNEKIDEISKVINTDFDKLLELHTDE